MEYGWIWVAIIAVAIIVEILTEPLIAIWFVPGAVISIVLDYFKVDIMDADDEIEIPVQLNKGLPSLVKIRPLEDGKLPLTLAILCAKNKISSRFITLR